MPKYLKIKMFLKDKRIYKTKDSKGLSWIRVFHGHEEENVFLNIKLFEYVTATVYLYFHACNKVSASGLITLSETKKPSNGGINLELLIICMGPILLHDMSVLTYMSIVDLGQNFQNQNRNKKMRS